MGPDWLGSPQHFIAGAAVAIVAIRVTRDQPLALWVALVFAVGAAALAESAWEIAEYGLRYAGNLRATAYWDTIADLAATLVGAVLGALGAISFYRRKSPAGLRAH